MRKRKRKRKGKRTRKNKRKRKRNERERDIAPKAQASWYHADVALEHYKHSQKMPTKQAIHLLVAQYVCVHMCRLQIQICYN